jgi:hypothetical protein
VTAFDADQAHAFLSYGYQGLNGLIWIGAFDLGGNQGEFFHTTQDEIGAAVRYAEWLDEQKKPGIYFRVTTTQRPESGRGLAEHTVEVPFMWADLDFGTVGHKSSGLPPTEADAYGLIAGAKLPDPTVLIHSGGGLYPFWRIDYFPDLSHAARLAESIQAALAAASEAHGWEYGTGVGDLARVLRLPGSVNRKVKDNPRPCRVVGELR